MGNAGPHAPEIPETIVYFDDVSSLEAFSRTAHLDNLSFVQPRGQRCNKVIRVAMSEGKHYGTSLRYNFRELGLTEPARLTSRYYVYFPTDFEVVRNGGKLPGPAGTYGRAGWGGRPADGTNGWSARGQFHPSGNPQYPIQLGYYAYHADTESRFGEVLKWDKEQRGQLALGRWYHLTERIELNTPGQNDGVLRGWVDGKLAYERTDMRFRDTPDLRIEEFWFNVYYGGTKPSPRDNPVYFDRLSLSWSANQRS